MRESSASLRAPPVPQDGNGFINRQELACVMGNLGEALTPEEIQVQIQLTLLVTEERMEHRKINKLTPLLKFKPDIFFLS